MQLSQKNTEINKNRASVNCLLTTIRDELYICV